MHLILKWYIKRINSCQVLLSWSLKWGWAPGPSGSAQGGISIPREGQNQPLLTNSSLESLYFYIKNPHIYHSLLMCANSRTEINKIHRHSCLHDLIVSRGSVCGTNNFFQIQIYKIICGTEKMSVKQTNIIKTHFVHTYTLVWH